MDELRRLSPLQRFILAEVYEATLHEQKSGKYSDCWGARWTLSKSIKNPTRAQSAAASRALRRLDQRGLVIRRNDVSEGNRTTCVKLTDEGLSIAKRLTLMRLSEC